MNGVHFTFTTAAFVDTAEARAERVNEGIGGHALAVWLSSALRGTGYAASEPWVEDHGWDFDIRDGDRTYLCVCTIEDDESATREAHVSLDLSRGVWDRLTGRSKFDRADRVAAQIERILSGAPDVTGLQKDVAA